MVIIGASKEYASMKRQVRILERNSDADEEWGPWKKRNHVCGIEDGGRPNKEEGKRAAGARSSRGGEAKTGKKGSRDERFPKGQKIKRPGD